MITLGGSGMAKLQQCVNQAEILKAGGNGIYVWGIFGDA